MPRTDHDHIEGAFHLAHERDRAAPAALAETPKVFSPVLPRASRLLVISRYKTARKYVRANRRAHGGPRSPRAPRVRPEDPPGRILPGAIRRRAVPRSARGPTRRARAVRARCGARWSSPAGRATARRRAPSRCAPGAAAALRRAVATHGQRAAV